MLLKPDLRIKKSIYNVFQKSSSVFLKIFPNIFDTFFKTIFPLFEVLPPHHQHASLLDFSPFLKSKNNSKGTRYRIRNVETTVYLWKANLLFIQILNAPYKNNKFGSTLIWFFKSRCFGVTRVTNHVFVLLFFT